MMLYCHTAFVRNEPPLEADDAHWLLDFYSTFDSQAAEEEGKEAAAATTQRALECLAQIKGSFAFIVYDSVHVSAFVGPAGRGPV